MQIEVCLHPGVVASVEQLRAEVISLVHAEAGVHELHDGDELDLSTSHVLSKHCRHVRVFEVAAAATSTPMVHVHQLFDEEPAEESADGDDEAVAFQLWTLPAAEFDGLWESLIYEESIQPKLLRYVSTAMRFSESGVDSRVIQWNRVVLLHGPPGTGKTSLCKGLAHKLAIRMASVYAQGQLVEVNAHSLFSKWFSESGKLVLGMFARIREILEDEGGFVCVLIDEVESLTSARQAAVAGSEPSDAVRVVNALLTQLDQLRRYKNVLILTTSNLTNAIDDAFLDRADIKMFIGNPSVAARYQILRGCLHELGRVGLLAPFEPLLEGAALASLMPSPLPTFEQLAALEQAAHTPVGMAAPRNSMALHAVALACEGCSGRALRKLPFLAHALHAPQTGLPLPVEAFLNALYATALSEAEGRGARREAAAVSSAP